MVPVGVTQACCVNTAQRRGECACQSYDAPNASMDAAVHAGIAKPVRRALSQRNARAVSAAVTVRDV